MSKPFFNIKLNTTALSGIFIAIYILYLAFSNKLLFYIHPDYKIFAIVMGGILLFFSLYRFVTRPRAGTLQPILLLTCLMIFILGIALPPRTLTSNTALRRGFDTDNINLPRSLDNTQIAASFGQDKRTYDIATWLKLFSLNPEPTKYTGEKVSVVGFYYKENDTPTNIFLVARFVITCCNIDARPVGLYVESATPQSFGEEEWIEVQGEFAVRNIHGKDQAVIVASSIQKTSQPENPYIY